MELQELLTAISTVGFPIAMCVHLVYSSRKRDEKYTAAIEDLRRTVENNTIVISRFIDKVGD